MGVVETIDPLVNDTLEPVLFTKLSIELIDKSKPSEFHKIMQVIGSEWGLNIAFEKDYKTAKRIIINSIKNN